ncbi:MAG: TrbG/VirB9 family P-type conjugative transfer protein [Rickettsiales bacterium]|nr:TrbG/VirB9 family P-type conjugative transfer protein [Rickettsiales bacterium]
MNLIKLLKLFLRAFFCCDLSKLLLLSFCFFSYSNIVLAQQLNPITTDSRIRTLVYNPNEVYELKFYYGYQSFIEFAEDEEIEMISIGEAFAWRLTPTGKRLFIRPLEIAGHTNMTIISNKRTYHFDIRSGEYDGKADEELVYTIRFFYPQIGQPLPIPPLLTVPNPAPPRKPLEKTIIKTPFPGANVANELPNLVARNPEVGEFNFDFSLAGKSDSIAPVKVYDDGTDTFFQFPNDNANIPKISLVNNEGVEQPLTYIIRDSFVVVPNVGRQFTLRMGANLLCVYNNKLINLAKGN